jgi:hypothetical protein
MEPEGSSSCSQKPSTGPYPEPDWSSPHHPIRSSLTLFTRLRLGLSSGLFFSGLPTNILHASLLSPICILHIPQKMYNIQPRYVWYV